MAMTRLSIENRLEEIVPVTEAFEALCEEHGVSPKVRRPVLLVLDDLLTNVISYAYEDDDVHTITVEIDLTEDRLTVTICDDGSPFDPFDKTPPDTSLPLEERTVGGLGIYLVEKLMDEVHHDRVDGMNVVTIVKHLEAEAG